MKKLLALNWDEGRLATIDLTDGTPRIITDDTGDHPDGVTFDGTTIYWTTMGAGVPADNPEGADYSARNGGVHAIDLDGTNRRDVIPVGATTTGKQIVYSRGHLYWGNREAFALSTVGVDGEGLHDLVKRDGARAQRDWIVGVAVDEINGLIYWSQKGSYEGGDGQIFRAGLEIPAGETAADRGDIELLWDNLPAPINLELVDDRLFWTDRGHHPGGNSLNVATVPAVGAAAEAPTLLADGFEEAIGLAVDKHSHLAYVSDLAGRVWVVSGRADAAARKRVLVEPGIALTGLTLMEEDGE